MQNKGYQTPYGSTVVPGIPNNIPTGNGIAPGEGPSGVPSAIPGTIGVAGLRMRNAQPSGLVPPEQTGQPRIPTIAEAMGQGALDDALDGLVKLLADRLAPKIAELVATRVVAKISQLGEQALAAAGNQAADAFIAARRIDIDHAHARVQNDVQAPPMFAGSAAGIRDYVEAGVKAASTHAVGISAEQIEAYSKAHAELEDAVHVGLVGDHVPRGQQPIFALSMLRRAPEPPVFLLTAQNGARSTWSAYSAAYDQPRFRLATPPGVLPADRFLVGVDGEKLGYMMVPHLLGAMNDWLAMNVGPVQADATGEVGSSTSVDS